MVLPLPLWAAVPGCWAHRQAVESFKAQVTSTGQSYIGQRTSYHHGAYDGSIWQHVIQSCVHSPYLIGFGCTFLKQLWDILTLFEKPEMCGQEV